VLGDDALREGENAVDVAQRQDGTGGCRVTYGALSLGMSEA
jgi:hypothetical protein